MEWISIKDRLPDREPCGYKDYIVLSRNVERSMTHIGVLSWRNNSFEDSSGDKVLLDDGYWEITHWMHLPEAPKEMKNA
jgi:hypothetical protein